MKRKMIFGVLVTLLVLQTQTVFAANDWLDFCNAIKQNNLRKAENILKNDAPKWTTANKNMCLWAAFNELRGEKTLQALELLKKYNFNLGDQWYSAFSTRQPDDVIYYLIDNGDPGSYALYLAFEYNRSNAVIDKIMPFISEIDVGTIGYAISARKFNYIPRLISICNDLNYRSNPTDKYYTENPERWKPEYSKTALIKAAEVEHFPTIKLLVEAGANVNIRAEDGSTAASIAYDRGNMEIYNYLKSKGAIDFEPRQVTSQPAAPAQSTTNVYVQPSAPAQTTPQQTAPATPTLQTGRYAFSGSNVTMTLNSGIVSLYVGNSAVGVGHGTYRISGNQVTVSIIAATGDYKHMQGKTWAYNITSSTSFNGHGENWVRTGAR